MTDDDQRDLHDELMERRRANGCWADGRVGGECGADPVSDLGLCAEHLAENRAASPVTDEPDGNSWYCPCVWLEMQFVGPYPPFRYPCPKCGGLPQHVPGSAESPFRLADPGHPEAGIAG